MKIVLFEDTPPQAERLVKAIRVAIGTEGSVELFTGTQGPENKTYEERLFADLKEQTYADATLIVADRDLSKTKAYRGLSESIVRRVADRLAVPQCSYASNSGDDFILAAEEREARIAVSISRGEDKCAQQIVAIARGFRELHDKLVDMKEMQQIAGKRSEGKTLASLLGKPEYADKIALYASGDRNRPGHVLNIGKGKDQERLKRVTCLFGYWLWDSVLQFPGVVVNDVAAASYLNIGTEEFCGDTEICGLFSEAIYTGPFAQAKERLWWRGMLDDMVAGVQVTDGRELAATRLNRAISRSECSEDSDIPAGYYCMLSKQPVSLQNSRPGLAWFPRGADLARVSHSRYEELGPWL